MSKIRDEYQKQMDAFCEKNNTISAQDILNRAKNQTPTEEKVVEFKPKKSKGMVWKAAIPAVLCFLLIGTTTVAATGHLSDLSSWFRNLFKDEKTAEIIDAGYYGEVNEVVQDELFEVQIVGASGDTENAQLLLDIYVKDPEMVKDRDKIHISAYCLGKDEYENELAHYAPWEAYGERDAAVDNLYHVSLRTGIWVANGEETVLEIVKIRLGSQMIQWKEYEVSLTKEIQIPRTAFYQVTQVPFDFVEFKYKNKTYCMIWALCGYYHTELIFRDLDIKGHEAGANENKTWLEFIEQVALVVDGVEYKVNPGEESRPWYESSDGGHYHMHPYFPGFEYEKATTVEVRFGDTVYKVK